jgi:hypothetical protein
VIGYDRCSQTTCSLRSTDLGRRALIPYTVSMANINHDQLFKELLTTFFVEFLELFFPSVLEYLDTDTITFVNKELFTDVVRGEKKIMDIVAQAQFQQQNYSFLIHIENESSSKTNFNQRLFRYFCNLYLRFDRPIYPIVVFSYDSPQRLDKNNLEQQERIMELTTSWEQKGIAKGQSNTILRLLNRKLGNLPENLADSVKSLEAAQLDSLTEDLLDFQTLDDLQNWLSSL